MKKFQKPEWKITAERERKSLPDWYSLTEAAKILGHANPSYLSQLVSSGKLYTYKIGQVNFIDADQLQALIDKKNRD